MLKNTVVSEKVIVHYLMYNDSVVDTSTLNSTISLARGVWLDFLWRMPNPEHLFIMQYLAFIALIVCLIVFLSYFFAPSSISTEKVSSYECGFEPFGDARSTFDIHFYLIGILFLIFDLEVVYLLPWFFSFVPEDNFLYGNIVSMFLFLLFLGIGFVYEWRQNALIWAPVHINRPLHP
jgi:NADH-quinone oxidoreductase subunit A